jgi:putative acetyltransferase
VITIRLEEPRDVEAIRGVNRQAFQHDAEAQIVDDLRQACSGAVSLVAESDGVVVGHVLFSPVTIRQNGATVEGMGLGPMAVLPARQRTGIGSKLVEVGVQVMRDAGHPFVVVLGHPEYYPRFGFRPASEHGLVCQWDGVPDEAFLVITNDDAVMRGVTGSVWYRPEFEAAL